MAKKVKEDMVLKKDITEEIPEEEKKKKSKGGKFGALEKGKIYFKYFFTYNTVSWGDKPPILPDVSPALSFEALIVLREFEVNNNYKNL